nr:Gmad2 immunoglobulin-like domain-containing protein [Actinomycetota bacterium]
AATTTALAEVTTAPPATDPATTATTGGPTTATTAATPSGPDIAVLWPVGDEVVTDPVQVVTELMAAYLPDSDVVVGEFQQGDANSGEVPVTGGTENGGPGNLRTTVLVRRFGEGWYATAAINPFVSVNSPVPGEDVDPGPFLVGGAARGFEATVVVTVLPAGGGSPIDQQVTSGGAFADPVAYTAEIDFIDAPTGTAVVLVQGGTGLEGDPGEFSAIPVTVGER